MCFAQCLAHDKGVINIMSEKRNVFFLPFFPCYLMCLKLSFIFFSSSKGTYVRYLIFLLTVLTQFALLKNNIHNSVFRMTQQSRWSLGIRLLFHSDFRGEQGD